jgi:nitrite reductase/ring-hydroxylating ferredoxin subunit
LVKLGSLLEQRTLAPSSPVGWYVVAFSTELGVGALLTRRFFGGEVVVYRNESGKAVVTRPYCPHLGAHLGHGGRVVGETLRCPFHGFRFDAAGVCVEGYPGKKTPPKCELPVLPSREKNGQVLVFYHPHDEPPGWEVPDLPMEGYRPLRWEQFDLAGHPQETSENSVDIGHFAAVHEYEQVTTLRPMTAEGPLLHGHYSMHRRRAGLSRPLTTDFQVRVWGLGYSVVEAHVHEHSLTLRTFVLSTPSSTGRVDLRIALSLKSLESKAALHPLALLAPRALLEPVLERLAMRAYAADVKQDFDIWNHKTYLDRPSLADGDGPVGLFRKWARQFYVGEAAQTLSS